MTAPSDIAKIIAAGPWRMRGPSVAPHRGASVSTVIDGCTALTAHANSLGGGEAHPLMCVGCKRAVNDCYCDPTPASGEEEYTKAAVRFAEASQEFTNNAWSETRTDELRDARAAFDKARALRAAK